MSQPRNIVFHGLWITLRRLPALLWTYIFNLALALLFSIRFHSQLASVMNHSLAAQRLTGGFDLAAVTDVLFRLQDGATGNTSTNYSAIPLYFIVYFLLVPGTLFCYLTKSPARLSTLLHQGLLHFWRFFRITLLTILAFILILGPLFALHTAWMTHVDNHVVGLAAFLHRLADCIILFLVASVLRVYFDLVEVYTVQLGLQLRKNGRPDRRVRRALGPAWRALRHNFGRIWFSFLVLTILGALAVFLTTRISTHMLAQPRVWPMFLLIQLGLFFMLFTRFWQRGMETSLVLQYPIALPAPLPFVPSYERHTPPVAPPPPPPPLHPAQHIETVYNIDPLSPIYPAPLSSDNPIDNPIDSPIAEEPTMTPTPTPPPTHPSQHIETVYNIDPLSPIYPAPLANDNPIAEELAEPATTPLANDPIPNPEPASPSLDHPDPGVFHHDPNKPSQ